MLNDFYVYLHRKELGENKGQIFYVGKGRGYRAHDRNGRNTKWTRTANKYGFTVDIISSGMNENDAYEFEELVTQEIGLKSLANLVYGGGGTSGRKMTEDNKKKLIEARKNYVATDETRERMRKSAKKYVDGHGLNDGFDRTGTKWTEEMRNKLLNPDIRKKIGLSQRKPILCSNGMSFSCGDDAANWILSNYGCKWGKSYISMVCRGKRKSAYGLQWQFIEKEVQI